METDVKKSLKVSILKWTSFVMFQLVFGAIVSIVLVFYGPFDNIKSSLVGSAMMTYSHQYIATFFLSDKAIERIQGINVIVDDRDDNTEPETDLYKFDSSKKDNSVKVFNIDGGRFKGKLLKIADPNRVELGYTSKMPLAGETTSSIAKKSGAIAAINAGGFVDEGYTGTGGAPLGFIIHNGEVVYNQYKSNAKIQDAIAFTKDGMMIVGRYSIDKLLELDVKEGVSFGPPLVINGKGTIPVGDGGWGIAPRTAIGQAKDGTVLFLVIDGRSFRSMGATLLDLQEIFLKNDAVMAVNLDGGSSATMYYDGKVINVPSDPLGERTVPTAFLVK